jgi:hypothetical protein
MEKKKNRQKEILDKILGAGLSEKELNEILKDQDHEGVFRQAARMLEYLRQCGQQRVKWNNIQVLSGRLASKVYDDFIFKNTPGNERAGICRYDSSIFPLPDGVRPAAVDTRRLRYTLDSCDLELSIYPINLEAVELIGQIRGLSRGTSVDVALRTKGGVYETRADKYQLFRFNQIPSGIYRLYLFSNKDEIGFINLEL